MIKRQQTNMFVPYAIMCLRKRFKSLIKEIQNRHAINVISTSFSKFDPDNICKVFLYGRDSPLISQKMNKSVSIKSQSPHQSFPSTKSFSLPIKVLVLPLLLPEMSHESLKKFMKMLNNKTSQFSVFEIINNLWS